MQTPSSLRLSNDRIAADVDVAAGGRITQLRVDGVDLLVTADEVPAELREPDGPPAATAWGSFPMVPWAGRVRHGRFRFRGQDHRLPINFGEHAIHGVGFDTAWTVTVAEPTFVRLELTLPTDDRWPFGGVAVQEISLTLAGVLLRMDVTATDRAFPAAIGWHPWFRKPDRLDFAPTAMYRRDDEGIAVDELVEVPPPPWDDCFVNRAPVGLTIDDVELRLTSSCSCWTVFDAFPHATCVEPQTGPPDAFNIAPHVLEPGDALEAWFRIETT
ncbi:MAG: aldose 1-epimerase [Acidimicrobiia bacterium]